MSAEDIAREALMQLPYDPNDQQLQVLAALARFLGTPDDGADRAFVLNGYAGTGKTSLVGAVVRAMAAAGRQVIQLAPTGRAAKVFSLHSGMRAYTIHRHIYRTALAEGTATVADNRTPGALFVVDEASMIGEGESGGHLLADLLQYVFSAPGCRLILMGDTAQLPPVGLECSPAMNPEVLRSYRLKVTRAVMTMTVRQGAESGILWNATRLRKAMKLAELPEPKIRVSGFDDVRVVEGEELADAIAADYGEGGQEQTIIVTRSNARAVRFNLAVRSLINMSEEELVRGERLMIAKNNYHWSRSTPGFDFVANGEMAVVTAIHGTEERYGLRFADVSLALADRTSVLDCKIILDSLVSEHPSLDATMEGMLREGILREASGGAPLSATECAKVLRGSDYFNALRVKYAYAVTCHKAQGGQWSNVYVDLGYVSEETPGLEFYRWLYTAVTRATGRLSLISPVVGIF